MPDVPEAKMERLYDDESKILVDDWEWEEVDGRAGNYTARATVQSMDNGVLLTVHGEIFGPPSAKKYSFVLRYKNNAIRTWDFNDHHEGIEAGHKHKYREATDVAYEPYSVDDVSTSDVNQALIDFLDECKVDTNGVEIHELHEITDYA